MSTKDLPIFAVPDSVETPAVCVDHTRMVANIERMARALANRGTSLRPHAKTHKSPLVAAEQLRHGACGVTTSTLSEAEVFADAGIADIFVAYPIWADAPRAERINSLLERVAVTVGVESIESAEQLGRAVHPRLGLRVLVEVDSGEHRTGVSSPEAAVAVANAAGRAGLVVAGVFTHGGHSYRGRAASLTAAEDEVTSLTAAAAALRAAGHDAQVVSAGSTPTVLLSARPPITEERPGTYVFGDRQQVEIGAHRASDIALYVAATVVSTTRDGQYVLDAGAKMLTKDSPPTLVGFGVLPQYPGAVIRRLYDHHAVVESNGERPSVGDRVAVVPNHVCPVVNASDVLIVVRDGTVEEWPVAARGRNR